MPHEFTMAGSHYIHLHPGDPCYEAGWQPAGHEPVPVPEPAPAEVESDLGEERNPEEAMSTTGDDDLGQVGHVIDPDDELEDGPIPRSLTETPRMWKLTKRVMPLTLQHQYFHPYLSV